MTKMDAEGTSPRRHGRRARAVSEEELDATGSGRRAATATGDLAFFARRTAVLPPVADALLPELKRFQGSAIALYERPRIESVEQVEAVDTSPEPQVADTELQVADAETVVDAGADVDAAAEAEVEAGDEVASAEASVVDPTIAVPPVVPVALPDEPTTAIPTADVGAKKGSWFGARRGKKDTAHTGAIVSPDAQVEPLGDAEAVTAESYDLESANATDTHTFDPADIEQYEADVAGDRPGATAAGIAGVAAENAGAFPAAELSADDEVELDASAEDLADATEGDAGADSALSDLEAAGADDAGVEGVEPSAPEAPAAVWTSEPDSRGVLSPATQTLTATERAGVDEADWYEMGDLPADRAPEPKAAPRFDGTVLNKPARTSAGVGAWITWILVFAVLVGIIVMLVTGVIGPGMLSSAAPFSTLTPTIGGLLT
ncbi:MAG: hypothetical protein Q4G21_11220 [Dermabacter sp.]|nr:hypothetical protein [Dermabacter sp.]